MKSIFGTIIIFIGLYIMLYFDIFGFFAQSWVLVSAVGLVLFMLILAVFVIGIPKKEKGGQNDKKDIDLQ